MPYTLDGCCWLRYGLPTRLLLHLIRYVTLRCCLCRFIRFTTLFDYVVLHTLRYVTLHLFTVGYVVVIYIAFPLPFTVATHTILCVYTPQFTLPLPLPHLHLLRLRYAFITLTDYGCYIVPTVELHCRLPRYCPPHTVTLLIIWTFTHLRVTHLVALITFVDYGVRLHTFSLLRLVDVITLHYVVDWLVHVLTRLGLHLFTRLPDFTVIAFPHRLLLPVRYRVTVPRWVVTVAHVCCGVYGYGYALRYADTVDLLPGV